MPDRKRVVLLGATGSIGESTLSVIRQNPDQFELIGVAANRNAEALSEIQQAFGVRHLSLFQQEGLDGLVHLARLPEADVVIVATTGTVGLRPTLAALEAGKRVGLANKETLVLGGSLIMPVANRYPDMLLPVDSEHNAIFQCLAGIADQTAVRRLLLTASGGPFLHHTRRELALVSVEEALRHPNWDMGPKVTVDSATMANKGLEMIEAYWLFGLQPDHIEVVIHPQSIIHSMVEFRDGSVIAQLSPPSMTYPIQHVLSYPDRLPAPHPPLDWTRIHQLELRPPDLDKFPNLRLAREALMTGGVAPAVYNAANQVAVEAFLDKTLPFTGIAGLVERCLEKADFGEASSVEELEALEQRLLDFSRQQLKDTAF